MKPILDLRGNFEMVGQYGIAGHRMSRMESGAIEERAALCH